MDEAARRWTDDEAFVFFESVAMLRHLRRAGLARDEVRAVHKLRSNFARRIRRRWGDALDAYIRTVVFAIEMGRELNHQLRNADPMENPNSIEVLTRLQAQSCTVALEIWDLLSSGYADGADGRARTLHELHIVARFIEEHGEETARRFWQHGAIEQYRYAVEFNDSGIGDPLDSETMDRLARDRDDKIAQFGKPFGKPFGWASLSLGKEDPKFSDLERAIAGTINIRWMYRRRSHNVHPSAWAITNRLGSPGQDSPPLFGPSLLGLDRAGAESIRALYGCTAALVLLQFDDESMIRLSRLRMLVDETEAAFNVASSWFRERQTK